MLLSVPTVVGWSRDADNRATYAAFGAVWLAAVIAAALGNRPTPIVGYGGSAILVYALSLLALPRLAGVRADIAPQASGRTNSGLADHHLLAGLA